MTKKIEDAKLGDLLPSSIRRDERMRAAAESIQPWLTTIAEAGPDGQLYVDLNDLTSEQLDHLAWQFNADVWRDTWPNNIKRSTLRNIIEDKRLKGTRWAVESAVQRLGSTITLEEWWEVEPKGPPHTFTIRINVHEIPDVDQQELTRDLYRSIDLAKPVRSHYVIVIEAEAEAKIGVLSVARPLVYRKMHMEQYVHEFHPMDLNPIVWHDPDDPSGLFTDPDGQQNVEETGDPIFLSKNKGTLGSAGDAIGLGGTFWDSDARAMWQPNRQYGLFINDLGRGENVTIGAYIPYIMEDHYPMQCGWVGFDITGWPEGFEGIGYGKGVSLTYNSQDGSVAILQTHPGHISGGFIAWGGVGGAGVQNLHSNQISGQPMSNQDKKFILAGAGIVGDVFVFDYVLNEEQRMQLLQWMEDKYNAG